MDSNSTSTAVSIKRPLLNGEIRLALASNSEIFLAGAHELLQASGFLIRSRGSLSEFVNSKPDAALKDIDVAVVEADLKSPQTVNILNTFGKDPHLKLALIVRPHETASLQLAISGGARGIVGYDNTGSLLSEAIQKIYLGDLWIDSRFTEYLITNGNGQNGHPGGTNGKLDKLTPREIEIVMFLLKNKVDPMKIVAFGLAMSESTLRNHLTSIYGKLNVSNIRGLLALDLECD